MMYLSLQGTDQCHHFFCALFHFSAPQSCKSNISNIFILFSYWNIPWQNLVLELCSGTNIFIIYYSCCLNWHTVLWLLIFGVFSIIHIFVFTFQDTSQILWEYICRTLSTSVKSNKLSPISIKFSYIYIYIYDHYLPRA